MLDFINMFLGLLVFFLFLKISDLKEEIRFQKIKEGQIGITLENVGVCKDCLEIFQMDEEGPFSSCKCYTREDHAVGDLQKYQILKRYFNVIDVKNGRIVKSK